MSRRRRNVDRVEEEESVASGSEIAFPTEEVPVNKSKEDASQRRQLRVGYRKLLNDLHGMGIEEDDEGNITHEAGVEVTSAKIKAHLETIERLYSKVTHTREAAIDSQVYRMIASNAGQKVQNLHAELVTFVPDEFAEKLITFLDVDREEYQDMLPNQKWVDIGRFSAEMFKTTPTLHTFSGTFDAEEVRPKEKPQRQTRAKVDNSHVKATIIQQVQQGDKLYEEKTTEEVENAFQKLRNYFEMIGNRPVCYFRFVVDPCSFSKTVENIFHASFLVKDGNAKISYDEYGLPVISPVDKETSGESNGSDRFALALGLNMTEWKEIITTFKIPETAPKRKEKP